VYIDKLNAIYFWKHSHPFWIDNNSFWVRLREDPAENYIYNLKVWLQEEDWTFKAFSLLRQINGCSETFKKKTKKYCEDYYKVKYKKIELWN